MASTHFDAMHRRRVRGVPHYLSEYSGSYSRRSPPICTTGYSAELGHFSVAGYRGRGAADRSLTPISRLGDHTIYVVVDDDIDVRSQLRGTGAAMFLEELDALEVCDRRLIAPQYLKI